MKEPALIAELALPAVRLKLLRSKQQPFNSIKTVRDFSSGRFYFLNREIYNSAKGFTAVSGFFCIKDTAQFFSKSFDPMGFLQEPGSAVGQQILDCGR